MGLGGSILLMAAGAILTFAVNWQLAGVDLDTVGVILMLAGLVGTVAWVSVFRRRRTQPPPAVPVVEDRRYYDQC